MEALAGHDLRQWQGVDREFHFTLLAHAGDRLMRTIRELYDHADRYRWLYIKGVPRALSIAADEHKAIFEASASGDAALAAAHLARHLARTALTVLTHHAPEHDPTTVRAAIRLATGAETPAWAQPRAAAQGPRDRFAIRPLCATARQPATRVEQHQNVNFDIRIRNRGSVFAFAVTRPKSVAVGLSCGLAKCWRFSMFAASRRICRFDRPISGNVREMLLFSSSV